MSTLGLHYYQDVNNAPGRCRRLFHFHAPVACALGLSRRNCYSLSLRPFSLISCAMRLRAKCTHYASRPRGLTHGVSNVFAQNGVNDVCNACAAHGVSNVRRGRPFMLHSLSALLKVGPKSKERREGTRREAGRAREAEKERAEKERKGWRERKSVEDETPPPPPPPEVAQGTNWGGALGGKGGRARMRCSRNGRWRWKKRCQWLLALPSWARPFWAPSSGQMFSNVSVLVYLPTDSYGV